jgi:hypothetical protein
MVGVKGSVDGASSSLVTATQPIRPRRTLYGRDRLLRPYSIADAAAAALMQNTRLGGEPYLSHLDMGDRVALLSSKHLLLLGAHGEELLVLKFKHIDCVEIRDVGQRYVDVISSSHAGQKMPVQWGLVVVLNTPRRNGAEVEVIACNSKDQAQELHRQIDFGRQQAPFVSSTKVACTSSPRISHGAPPPPPSY